MSIIVKGMKMPTTCTMCDLAHAMKTSDGSVRLACGVKGNWQDTYTHRHAWCPIVEIPEKHGRLIDADEKRLRITLKCIREGEYQIYKGGAWGFAAKAETAIDDAPTVFEAEGQE